MSRAQSFRVKNPFPGKSQPVYICIGPNCWGKGATKESAIREAKKNQPYRQAI